MTHPGGSDLAFFGVRVQALFFRFCVCVSVPGNRGTSHLEGLVCTGQEWGNAAAEGEVLSEGPFPGVNHECHDFDVGCSMLSVRRSFGLSRPEIG
jgi:hypothetical protein